MWKLQRRNKTLWNDAIELIKACEYNNQDLEGHEEEKEVTTIRDVTGLLITWQNY